MAPTHFETVPPMNDEEPYEEDDGYHSVDDYSGSESQDDAQGYTEYDDLSDSDGARLLTRDEMENTVDELEGYVDRHFFCCL